MGLSTDLTGRVAIVTGASSGLGRRFASVLANAGAQVVAAARRVERLEELASSQPGIVPVRCDVADAHDRKRVVAAALELAGHVDILRKNAGIASGGPDRQSDPAVFTSVMEVNVEALFALTQ